MEGGGEVLTPDIDSIADEKHNNDAKPKIKDFALIQLREFIKNVAGTIKIPMRIKNSNPSQVVRKIDIKGTEVDIIPYVLFSGDFQ